MAKELNLIARLVLDSKQWSGDIQLAQKDIKALQSTTKNAGDFMSNFGGTLASTATKFAGWAGAGLAAKEGLEKFLRAGQTTSDFIDREVAAWSGSFDEFFRAMNSGSVTGFVANMGEVADAIREAAREMDKFADANASLQVWDVAYTVKQKQLLELIKRNKDNPELVKQYQKELKELEKSRRMDLSSVTLQKEDAINAVLNSKITAPSKGGVGDIDQRLATYISNRQSGASIESVMNIMKLESTDRYGVAIADAKEMASKMKTVASNFDVTEAYSAEFQKNIGSVLTTFQEKYNVGLLELLRWDELDDKKMREPIRQSIQEYWQMRASEFEFNERNTEIFNMGKGAAGGKGTAGGIGKTTTLPPEGSMAELEAAIKQLTTAINMSTSATERDALKEQLLNTQGSLATMRMRANYPDLAMGLPQKLEGSIAPLSTDVKVPELAKEVEPVMSYFEEGDNKWLDNTIEGMGALSSAMSSLSGITDEGTAAWLQWGAKALDSLRSVFQAMISTGLVSSATSAAQSGPLGWLSMGVAVAQAIAVFASIPKFAGGGIVPGSSYSGDKVMAGLNSGEMILNSMQQQRLFNMLNGGAIASAPQVELKVRGTDLVAVLNNYSARRAHVV